MTTVITIGKVTFLVIMIMIRQKVLAFNLVKMKGKSRHLLNSKPLDIDGLLGNVLKRAVNTLENRDELESSILENDGDAGKASKLVSSYSDNIDGLLEGALKRASNTLNIKEDLESILSESDNETKKVAKFQPSYNDNPCVNFAALAHKQWEHILRPGVDSAIDATCGNGHDSKKLAEILFSGGGKFGTSSELICIDMQANACDATREAVMQVLDDPITFEENIQILQTSHESLPEIDSPVALVCWNLGYLPNSNDKFTRTKMESTVASITDAALSLRVGGLLSIMTYPKTNANEDHAVHVLLEGLSLLSSKTINYEEFLASLEQDPYPDNDDSSDSFKIKKTVTNAIYRIVEKGGRKQTWRVMEHKMLGRSLSPILLTATRIK